MKKKPSVWFYVTLATIAVIAIGSAVLRAEQASVEGTPRLVVLSSAVLLTVVLLGPSLIGKHLLVVLLPIEAKVRQRKLLRRLQRDDQRRVDRAEKERSQRLLQDLWWVQEAKTIDACYRLAYVEQGGKLPPEKAETEDPTKQQDAPPKHDTSVPGTSGAEDVQHPLWIVKEENPYRRQV